MKSPWLPYVRHEVTPDDIASVAGALASDRLAQGPRAESLEERLSEEVGAAGAVSCSSGTAALHLAMMAMGVKPGDRVITTPMTFCATANAIAMCGGRPLFVDVEPLTLNLDPKLVRLALEERKGSCDAPVGILAVHYAGRPCNMAELSSLAKEFGVWLVEDACHALGAVHPGGGDVGSKYADLSCWSFHPAKHVAAGEGGAVTCPARATLLERLLMLRDNGRDGQGLMQVLGCNYRMDEMSAALALSQLDRLNENLARLLERVIQYRDGLRVLGENVKLPIFGAGCAWHLFRVAVPGGRRDALQRHLFELGIGTQLHYRPVHLQPYYEQQGLGTKGQCPVAEKAWEEGLSLPLFASMTADDVDRVCVAVRGFFS